MSKVGVCPHEVDLRYLEALLPGPLFLDDGGLLTLESLLQNTSNLWQN